MPVKRDVRARRMSFDETIQIGALPSTLMEVVMHDLAQFSIGFIQVVDIPGGQDAFLLGSGTLVQAGETSAILTAHHVLENLPRFGRMGLILAPSLHQTTIDTSGTSLLKIGRGSIDSDGPDLGAVILSRPIAAALASKKRFYNLDRHRDQLLDHPPHLRDGIWFVHGFLGERTTTEPEQDGFKVVKQFYSFSGAGGPDLPILNGRHDYFAFPVSPGGQANAPLSFGGMSGGGLWQVPLARKPGEELVHMPPLFSGVVFYQQRGSDDEFFVKCHGRQSVYRVAYAALQGREP